MPGTSGTLCAPGSLPVSVRFAFAVYGQQEPHLIRPIASKMDRFTRLRASKMISLAPAKARESRLRLGPAQLASTIADGGKEEA